MSLLTVVEQEEVELELDLLIREARRRQRRRRLTLVLVTLIGLVGVGAATGALSGWLAGESNKVSAGGLSASRPGARCPASPVRWVANSQFDAYVVGTGGFRLGIGNAYRRNRGFVLGRGTRRWAGIEAIWWLAKPERVPGPITIRGRALDGQGPIEVRPSDGGQAPGSGPLTLPDDFQPAPHASPYPAAYPGSIWVRAGGCYAVDVSGRGFSERLVLNVVTPVAGHS